MKSVIIFGAGIAGLSTAHELIQLGYAVSVYEATDQPGGFFRSSRLPQDNMPSEYSWSVSFSVSRSGSNPASGVFDNSFSTSLDA